jgi:hypothetical protein
MTMRGFREVGWVAAVAGTALGCYMVSLQVASERAALEEVQNRIVLAQRDIRVLQTEIGTRGRLEQLESWNVKVLALSAPQAHQFLEGEFQLATLAAPKKAIDPAAPVVLASAPAPASPGSAISDDDGAAGERARDGATARDLMHVASLERDLPQQSEKTVDKPKPESPRTVKPAQGPAIASPRAASAPAKASAKSVPVTASRAEPKAKAPAVTSKSKDIKARQ